MNVCVHVHVQAKDMLRTPEQGADTVVWLASCPHPPRSGAFYFDREEHPTAFRFTNTESSRKVRSYTRDACGLFVGRSVGLSVGRPFHYISFVRLGLAWMCGTDRA